MTTFLTNFMFASDNKKGTNIKEKMKFPYKIVPFYPETKNRMMQGIDPNDPSHQFVKVGPKEFFFPVKYEELADRLWNFEARSTDIWICTFPRSGTTWTQELVWLLENNLDFETAKKTKLKERVPFFDFNVLVPTIPFSKCFLEVIKYLVNILDHIQDFFKPTYEVLEKMPGRRIIKTHLPISLLPPTVMESQAKIIYVARHPRDVAVSFYYLMSSFISGYSGTFEEFWTLFEKGECFWSPFWTHLEEGWALRDKPNVLFYFYEDIVRDVDGTINRVADFLGQDVNKGQLEALKDHLSIEKFKNNPAVNGSYLKTVTKPGSTYGFVRRGKSDGWQNEFTPELREQAKQWIEENLKRTNLRFPA